MEDRKIDSDIEALVQKYNLDADPFVSFSFRPQPVQEAQRYDESSKSGYSAHSNYESPQISFSRPQLQDSPNNSKAVASAMKALQDKLHIAEESRDQLQSDIEVLEKQSYEDKQRLSFELNKRIVSEKELEKKCFELDQSLKVKISLIEKLDEQVAFLNTQNEFIEAENRRNHDQHAIDKEN